MKRISFFLFLIIFCSSAFSQNVGIGTTTPNSSAQLDVNSTSKGFLPPRMTMAQRNTIANPVAGLMLWCTDCSELQVYDGANWKNVSTVVPPAGVQISSADDMTNWEISGGAPKGPQVANKKEGAAWLEADLPSGTNYLHFIYNAPSPVNSGGLTNATGQLKFWFYISDVTQVDTTVQIGQVELTSSGVSDFKEYAWDLNKIARATPFVNGWNEFKLNFSDAVPSNDGPPNLAALNHFRIYFWTKLSVHPTLQFGIDDVRVLPK